MPIANRRKVPDRRVDRTDFTESPELESVSHAVPGTARIRRWGKTFSQAQQILAQPLPRSSRTAGYSPLKPEKGGSRKWMSGHAAIALVLLRDRGQFATQLSARSENPFHRVKGNLRFPLTFAYH